MDLVMISYCLPYTIDHNDKCHFSKPALINSCNQMSASLSGNYSLDFQSRGTSITHLSS